MSYIDNQDVEKKRAFLEKIATMYYINERSQQEIADQFGIGRSSVARFLSEAKQAGIISIHIRSVTDQFRHSDLEQRIIDKYRIRDCVVLLNDNNGINDDIVPEYLDKIVPQKGILGVGGGSTMFNLAKKVWMVSQRPELQVMQLTGSLGSIPETSVTKLWADSLGAKGLYISAPLLVDDIHSKEVVENSSLVVSEALKSLKCLDTTIISIGATDVNTRVKYLNLIENIDVDGIYEKCVGDVVFHFFNQEGKFCLDEISQRVIGITREDYMRVPMKIVIAYGKQKAQATHAAIKGKLLDVLVTDNELAKTLLEF